MDRIENIEGNSLEDVLLKTIIWVRKEDFTYIRDIVIRKDNDTGDWEVRIYYVG